MVYKYIGKGDCYKVWNWKNLLCALLLFYSPTRAEMTCFIVQDQSQLIYKEGKNCSLRTSPCSTFKILLSLMGYQEGILENENTPTWPYQERPNSSHDLEIWKQSHNPTTWIQHSCVWYSRVLTQRVGMEILKKYVTLFNYGNQDLSGDKGKNNGLTHAWLSSSLKISAFEQLDFLGKLTRFELPVSRQAQQFTQNILFIDELPGGWKFFGKTGSGSQEDSNPIAWFIGWIQRGEHIITFVYLSSGQGISTQQAKEAVKARLTSLIVE